MSIDPVRTHDTRMQAAITELQELIRRRYPEARFCVRPSEEDPTILHLVTIVDVEDTDIVLDAVVDRMMDLQIEDGLPLFVIPVRPLSRTVGATG